jgi:hypothetical protein
MRAVQIVTAGQANETVIESSRFGGGHSVFSYHLVNGLTQGSADLNGDGIIPASELYAYLAPRITTDSGSRQTPKLFNMDGDGEFVFFTIPVGQPAALAMNLAGSSLAPGYDPDPTHRPAITPPPATLTSIGGSCLAVDNFAILIDQSRVMHLTHHNQSLNYLARKTAERFIKALPKDCNVRGSIYMYGVKASNDDAKVLRVQAMDQFRKKRFKDAMDEVDKQNGQPCLDLAFKKLNDDLRDVDGKTAVIVISGGDLGKGKSALEQAGVLKDNHSVCIYTIQVGNSNKGEKALNNLVEAVGCGFSSDEDSLDTDEEMERFLKILE